MKSLISNFTCNQGNALSFKDRSAHCLKCNKQVFDLSEKTEEDIHAFLEANPKACSKVPRRFVQNEIPQRLRFVCALLLVFGASLFTTTAQAQKDSELYEMSMEHRPMIKGFVLDETNAPVAYAQVILENSFGKMIGAITDLDGIYSITIDPDFAKIGEKFTIKVRSIGSVTIVMEEVELKQRMNQNFELRSRSCDFMVGVIISIDKRIIDMERPSMYNLSGYDLDVMLGRDY